VSDKAYLLRQDALGFKIAELAEECFDGEVFTLATGERVGKRQGWLANPENLLEMARHQPLKDPDQLSVPELTGTELVRFLGKLGYCLDHDWRVRRFMREPFTKLTALNVAPIVAVHLQLYKEEGAQKNPITLGWFDGRVGVVVPGNVVILPDGEPPEGIPKGDLVLVKTTVAKDDPPKYRLALKLHDWYLFPKDQAEGQPMCTLEMIQFLPEDRVVQTGADTVAELLGTDRFLTPEGMVVNRGSMLTISIDDFFKDPPPPPEEVKA
jgi:hypothetical protein